MEEVEIKVKIPRKVYDFVKALLALYAKSEEEFWREELMGSLECLIKDIDIPFANIPDIMKANGLNKLFDCDP